MINWANLAANSLWILGCAVALATISYASWVASVQEERFINLLKLSSYQIALNLAGLLFSAGLATTSDTTHEILLWTILAVAFFIQMTTAYIRKRKTEKTEPPS